MPYVAVHFQKIYYIIHIINGIWFQLLEKVQYCFLEATKIGLSKKLEVLERFKYNNNGNTQKFRNMDGSCCSRSN